MQIRSKNLSGLWAENGVGLTVCVETPMRRFSDIAYAYQEALPLVPADFLAGTLAGDRAREFTEKLRVAGVPI